MNSCRWTVLTFLAVISGCAVSPHVLPPLPGETGTVRYWIDRLEEPDRTILGPAAIQRINEGTYRRGTRTHPTFEHSRVPGGRIASYLEQDLRMLRQWIKYGPDGVRLRDPAFSGEMRRLSCPGAVPGLVRVRYGLTVCRTTLRVMPTDRYVLRRPEPSGFNLLQVALIEPGQPLALYHLSRDRTWGYVQTPFGRGWLRLKDAAWTDRRWEVDQYLKAEPFAVVTAASGTLWNPARGDRIRVGMGVRFPLGRRGPGTTVVRVPVRGRDGALCFEDALVAGGMEISIGYLPMSRRNVLIQAFRQIGMPYGWGGTADGLDCSQFILNILQTFGFEPPRSAHLQAAAFSGRSAPRSATARKDALPAVPVGMTLLEFPGHIGLYLGRVNGDPCMIHALWAVQTPDAAGGRAVTVGRVVVSTLQPGEGTANGSLLERLRRIVIIR